MNVYRASCQGAEGKPCDWLGQAHEAENLTQYDQMSAAAQGDADQHKADNPDHETHVIVSKE
jgi:hypothetical protein